MQFSHQTLTDCLITRDEPSSQSIARLFDYTRTDGGSRQLQWMLSQKMDGLQEVIDMQEALQYISQHLQQWDFGLLNIDLYYLEEYFRMDHKVVYDGQINTFWLLFSKKPVYLDFLTTGVKRVHVFLTPIIKKLESLQPVSSRLVNEKAARMIQLLQDKNIREFLQKDIQHATKKELLLLDHFLRFRFKETFYHLLELLYEIEAFCSLTKAIRIYDLVYPKFSSEGEFRVTGMRNPLIKDCIETGFEFSRNRNVVFLTGPNMAGKSSFLRTVGMVSCLAHAGMAVPAESAVLPYFDAIEININVNDDLTEGYSHFYAELQKVKHVAGLLQQGRKCFIVFDELFKGTNLTDITECSQLLIDGFLRHNDSYFIVSSHHLQLLEKNENREQIQCNYIEAFIEEGEPRFTYAVREGISSVQLGLYFFYKEGIDQLLIPAVATSC